MCLEFALRHVFDDTFLGKSSLGHISKHSGPCSLAMTTEISEGYPVVICYIAIENGHRNFVDFPMKNGEECHFWLCQKFVCQRIVWHPESDQVISFGPGFAATKNLSPPGATGIIGAVATKSLDHSIESWLVYRKSPFLDDYIPNMMGSIIPELIINQQGFWTLLNLLIGLEAILAFHRSRSSRMSCD